jgi:hypothetical protein
MEKYEKSRGHDVFQGTVMEITMKTFYLCVITSDKLEDWYEFSMEV